jgi:hypothetical protein
MSNCTTSAGTILSVKAAYTANLNREYMSGAVYEESETQTQGTMRAFLGGGRSKTYATGTTASAHISLPSATAGAKLNLFVPTLSYFHDLHLLTYLSAAAMESLGLIPFRRHQRTSFCFCKIRLWFYYSRHRENAEVSRSVRHSARQRGVHLYQGGSVI